MIDTDGQNRSSTLALSDFPPLIAAQAQYKARLPGRASRGLPSASGWLVDGRKLWFNTEAHEWLRSKGFTRLGRRWTRADTDNMKSVVRELRPGISSELHSQENGDDRGGLEAIRTAAEYWRSQGNAMVANELFKAAAAVRLAVELLQRLAKMPEDTPIASVRPSVSTTLAAMLGHSE